MPPWNRPSRSANRVSPPAGGVRSARPVDLWTGPLPRASRLSACGAPLWMAGWTTLRVAHAPTHRSSAAHKLHRDQAQRLIKKQEKPLASSATFQSPTPLQEATYRAINTPLYNLPCATQLISHNRSRSRNHRSRSPKYATRLPLFSNDEIWVASVEGVVPSFPWDDHQPKLRFFTEPMSAQTIVRSATCLPLLSTSDTTLVNEAPDGDSLLKACRARL